MKHPLFTSSGGRRIVSRETPSPLRRRQKTVDIVPPYQGVNQLRAFAREKTPYAAPSAQARLAREGRNMGKRRFSHEELDALFGGPVPPPPPTTSKKPSVPSPAPHPATQKTSKSSAQTPAAPQPPAPAQSTPVPPRAQDGGKPLPLPGAPAALPLDQIRPNPFQPRMEFNPAKLSEMADSIREHGVLQPLLVRKSQEGYQLVAGERRLRAARLAGLTEVPVLLVSITDQESLEIAMIENLQREDLNPIEEAIAYDTLIKKFALTQEEVAHRVGKDRTTVVNSLRLLRLPPEIREDLREGLLTPGHARALLSLDNEEQILRLRKEILANGLSVRRAEERAKELLGGVIRPQKPRGESGRERLPEIVDLENRLTETMGTRVRLRTTHPTRGRLEITYNSLEDLDRICALLGLRTDSNE